MKSDLRNFNPVLVARIECDAWKAYYEHRFLKLFFLLLKLMQHMFGFNIYTQLLGAYHSAMSAVIFRKNKGKENDKILQKILKHLEKFYALIERNSIQSFDAKKVAKLELEWWLVDRYENRYQISRADAIARAVAVFYKIQTSEVLEYATLRAEAMVLQDKMEESSSFSTGDNWNRILEILKSSYQSLYKTVNT